MRARTRVLVESEPVPLPPKSVLELEAIIDVGLVAEEVELDVARVPAEEETPISPGRVFLGEMTLATWTLLCPTASRVMSSKSKLGRRCGDSTLAGPSWIFGGGVSGRATSLELCTGLMRERGGGESVLISSECALEPDSLAGERGVATLAACEKKGDVNPMVGRENLDCSLVVG
jgi:hypothetical protein